MSREAERSTGRESTPKFRSGEGATSMSHLAPLADEVVVDPLVGHPPDFHVFHSFLERCQALPSISVAVCWPLTDVALSGAVEAATAGLIDPVLVGPAAAIQELAAS